MPQPSTAKTPTRRFTKTDRQQKHRQAARYRLIAFWGLLSMFALIVLAFLAFSPMFRLTNLDVRSADNQLSQEVAVFMSEYLDKSDAYISRKNQLLWRVSRANELLRSNFPAISKVDLLIRDHQMNLALQIHKPIALWCPHSHLPPFENIDQMLANCYGISSEGTTFQSNIIKDTLDQKDLVVITDNLPRPEEGQEVVDPSLIKQLDDLEKEFDKRDYEIAYSVIKDRELNLILTRNPATKLQIERIILPRHEDLIPEVTYKDLLLVLDEDELSMIASREEIEYFEVVDFSSPNKVFYRFVRKGN